jgi:DNA polymerase (family 10)
MDKHAVAHVLEQIAAFLELKGDSPFRTRAYLQAAGALRGVQGDLSEALTSGVLAETRGVGPATLEIAKELLGTGRCSLLEELKEQVPPDLVEMLRISGLGVGRVRLIHQRLGIETLEELEAAAMDGRLARLPRFGQRTAENILKGIAFLRRSNEYRLYHHAHAEAESLREALLRMGGVRRAEIAGSIRRRREVIRDLDLVLECIASRHELVKRLAGVAGVSEFATRDESEVTIRFAGGTVADVYLATPDDFGTVLLRATGSAAHLVELGPLPTASNEDDVYRALGVPPIPPELREGMGEVQTARKDALPRLVTRDDLQGFLHCHSNYSDGTTTIEEWALACAADGYRWLGLTDHSQAAAYAGGITPADIQRQHAEIDAVNASGVECTVLKGIEADILPDGRLDFEPDVLAQFDFVIGSVHSRFAMNREVMTERILSAMDDPHMTILGHPTGRLLLSRDPYPLDLDAVLEKAAVNGVAIEVNADPHRLDLDWRMVRRAIDLGVTLSIGADAHSTSGIGNMEFGLGVARKGWATSNRILNTLGVDVFGQYATRRRAG